MNRLKWMLMAATFSLLAAGSAFADSVGPVIEFDPANATKFGFVPDVTAGWSFTTNSAITVTALDAFDPTGTGLVRLYDASGDILASANLSTSDPVEGSPTPFYTQPVARFCWQRAPDISSWKTCAPKPVLPALHRIPRRMETVWS